jgi:hypothetical protein
MRLDFVEAVPCLSDRNETGILIMAGLNHDPILGNRPTTAPDISLACGCVFGIVVQLLVHFQMGSARQRPRTQPATSTFPLLRGDLRARFNSN